MRRPFLSILVAATFGGLSATVDAGDAAEGKKKTATCVACHGPEGIAIAPNYPNLACQQEQYLIKAINDYKSGVRKEPLMAPMVAALSDTDVENLAAYYSTLNCK